MPKETNETLPSATLFAIQNEPGHRAPGVIAISAIDHLPRVGETLSIGPNAGSADALELAQCAQRSVGEGRLMVVVAADATDVERLVEEVAWFAPELRIAGLPDWETLPYDAFSPHQDLISERLSTLWRLGRRELDVVIVAGTTALQRLAPPSFLAAHAFEFHKSAQLDAPGLRAQLVLAGYEHVSQVVKPGEYSVRGGLIDLFPMGSTLPYRIDLFDDEVDSIRAFDPDTQRTLYPVESVRLLPGREFPMDEPARTTFRSNWRERFEGDPARVAIYRDIGQGIAAGGLEYWLPLFFEQTATLFEYLPATSLIVLHGDVEAATKTFRDDAQNRWRFLAHDTERPLLEPDELFLTPEQFFVASKAFGRISFRRRGRSGPDAARHGSAGSSTQPLPELAIERKASAPLGAFVQFARDLGCLAGAVAGGNDTGEAAEPAASRILIVAESAGRRETIANLLVEAGIRAHPVSDWAAFQNQFAPICLTVGPIGDGFILRPNLPAQAAFGAVACITESELFRGAARRRGRGAKAQQTNVDAIIRDLAELKIGDPVVHAQHGIGRYLGLVTMDLGDGTAEFLELIYAGEAKLFVPVSALQMIGRYTGASPDDAPLHALGSGQWEKVRRKAAAQARDTAAELLNLYARRAARSGHAFSFDAKAYETFADGFGFEETPDQLAAIHAVVQDLVSGKPMDRLVCGDVGFGKTEVALRAAFVAVADGKQVAILVPTTLLAEQHFESVRNRFADWPVKVAELSRFRNAKEISAALKGLADGTIDIVIGTHKLLSKDVQFKRLGLLIIDEEHRFGVRQKETLKAMRSEVDVLTLTATPIPRTLAMSLEGLRDFSVIATAPQRRLAIKTFVRREESGAIREALLRELKRGGQVYFLHNEVETIENRRQMLTALVPEARIAVAHGQMHERDLESVMRDFHHQRFNVLLCTTIIETGIDVPTANTIVIQRADRFGLGQLHQLRGRVGRSHHQAYAYLLTPDESAMTRDAVSRLEAIQAMEELGSGFFLAMHDMEIRGAGEVLGEHQSGDVSAVGFQIYVDMIERAVRSLKAGKEPDLSAPLEATTEIRLHVPALLPSDYCPDVHERLTLYKRLASATDSDSLDAMAEELIDRFGKLPDPAKALIETHRLRQIAQELGLTRIDAASEAIVVQFGTQTSVEPEAIIRYLQSHKDVRMSGPDKIRITLKEADMPTRLARIRALLKALRPRSVLA